MQRDIVDVTGSAAFAPELRGIGFYLGVDKRVVYFSRQAGCRSSMASGRKRLRRSYIQAANVGEGERKRNEER